MAEGDAETLEPTGEEAKDQKISIHIAMEPKFVAQIKEMADYAAEAGIIPGDNRGNMTAFVNWCIEIGREMLKQYCLKRRKFI